MNARIATSADQPGAAPEGSKVSEARVSQALEAYAAAIDAGAPMSREDLIAAFPDVAEEVFGCLDSLDFIRQVAPQLRDDLSQASCAGDASVRPLATLGDFRLKREIGRGGMGVVYEAEQLSLGRRVALKVLPFAAMLDKQQLARFKNEARAAATLDHPNIVSIYSVGEERGVHYYAMQLVDGRSLAEVVQWLQRCRGMVSAEGGVASEGTAATTQGFAFNVPYSAFDTKPVAALSTLADFDSEEYFRAVARLGIQAAEAIDHAHRLGVFHRDIKPGNLLVDDGGKLWITDFGLARIEGEDGMTKTGALIGTLRYMSPEQTLAKRAVVDHRSDIYSLGVTLYELLTLHAAFPGDDRHKLLHSIASEEPRRPRRLNAAVPRDLETIVLTSMEKNSADRYDTALELADELRRFCECRPIRARRPTLLRRLAKFAGRHRALTSSAGLFGLMLLITAISALAAHHRHIVESRLLSASVQSALVGYWSFDGNGRDSSRLRHDLTLFGDVRYAPGLFDQALDLHHNPSTYAARTVADAEYDFGTENFTVQTWVNFYWTSAEQVLLDKLSGSQGLGWSFTKLGSNVFHFYAGGQYDSGPQTIAAGVWHHVIVRHKDSQLQIWFDGELVMLFTFFGAKSNPMAGLYVGRRNPGDPRDFSLNGRLDEVAIWNRALTDEEIAYLYNSGSGNRISQKNVIEAPALETVAAVKAR